MPNPAIKDARPTSPRSGNGLAVLGSFLGSAPDVAVDVGAAAAGAADGAAAVERAGAAPAGAAPPPLLLASVASTCFSVMTRGGFDVMMVADN